MMHAVQDNSTNALVLYLILLVEHSIRAYESLAPPLYFTIVKKAKVFGAKLIKSTFT